MGKAAGPLCSASTRGLVALLGAVPCLACKQEPPPPPPPRPGGAMSLAAPEGGPPALALGPGSDTYKGWLFKWTNYLKGYQRRWFVLSNGLLSYYRTQAEMAHTCRGTINLSTAHIDTEDSCNIVLSNGGRTYHLKATSEVERQRWVTALELAKAKAIRMRNNQSGRVMLAAYAGKGTQTLMYSLRPPLEASHLVEDCAGKVGFKERRLSRMFLRRQCGSVK